MKEAVRIGDLLNQRQIIVSTKEDPLKIALAAGRHNIEQTITPHPASFDSTDERYTDDVHQDLNLVNINYSVNIIGMGRSNTVIVGGLFVEGEDVVDVVAVSKLTICESMYNGVFGCSGASIHLEDVLIDECQGNGVLFLETSRNKMIDCEVSNNDNHGVWLLGSTLRIEGSKTEIHRNGENFHGEFIDYGIKIESNSTVSVVAPLTEQMISMNNQGGNIFISGNGTIKMIKTSLDKIEGRITTTSSTVNSNTTFCSYCNKPEPTNTKFNKCKGCRSVAYCNRECQIKHWKARPNGHKKQCKKLAAEFKTLNKKNEK